MTKVVIQREKSDYMNLIYNLFKLSFWHTYATFLAAWGMVAYVKVLLLQLVSK